MDSSSSSYERLQSLERIGRDAAKYWTMLPRELQTDKEFILKALHNSPRLPCKSDFERQFPQSLRFDRDVVLGFCHRPDFQELFQERHLFVPGCLASDKEVMMAYCRKIPRSLQECSEELCNDVEVVQAAISLGGLELQYASLKLQEDATIVQQACQSHGRALEFCPPGPTRDSLTSNRDFMKNVVLANPGGGPMWKLAPPALQNDPELLLQALKHGLGWRDVPKIFREDLSFLEQALEANSNLYLQLTPCFQSKQHLARQAVIAPDSTPDIHAKALGHCPSLARERPVMQALCQRGTVECLQELLALPSSQAFTDDLELMTIAVSREASLLSLASERLQVNPQLVLVSITPTSAWNTLKTLPTSIIRQHVEIAIRAIQLCVPRNLRYLPGHIPDDLWSANRPLCLAWLERGGRVLEAFEPLLVVQPPYTPADLELPLAVAKYNWSEVYKVGDALLRHRDFMEQALKLDGRVLRFAPLSLRHNLELQVLAVANHNNNNSRNNATVASTLGGSIDVPRLEQHIEKQLTLHQTFCQDFLRGIAIARPHQPPQLRSSLTMLDRGVETSQAFKRLIAEYLGVPLGETLTLLRRANENLKLTTTTRSSRSNNDASAAEAVDPQDLFRLEVRELDDHHRDWPIEDHPWPPHHQRAAFQPPMRAARARGRQPRGLQIRIGRHADGRQERLHEIRQRWMGGGAREQVRWGFAGVERGPGRGGGEREGAVAAAAGRQEEDDDALPPLMQRQDVEDDDEAEILDFDEDNAVGIDGGAPFLEDLLNRALDEMLDL